MSPLAIHPLARATLVGLDLPDPEFRERRLREGFLDLASNVNPYAGALGRYPSARPSALQERYATLIRSEQHASDGAPPHTSTVSAADVLMTSGSVEAISLLVAAFCEPRTDCVCVCEPTFPFYARAARCNDVEVHRAPLVGMDLNELDVRGILACRPKLTFLCSPSNPVGTTLDSSCVADLLRCASGLVVVDEAYIEFSTKPSVIRWLESSPQLVVLRTLSKAWGLAGLRLGAVIAQPAVLHTLRLVQLSYCINSPAQMLAEIRLSAPEQVEGEISQIRAQRAALSRALQELSVVDRVYPSDANFILVAFRNADDVLARLLEAHILVADCRHHIPGALRIAIGTESDCARLLNVLRGVVPPQVGRPSMSAKPEEVGVIETNVNPAL